MAGDSGDQNKTELTESSLDIKVSERLNEIFKIGKLSPPDINKWAMEKLTEFSVDQALKLLDDFLEGVDNVYDKGRYLVATIKLNLQKSATTPAASNVSNDSHMLAITEGLRSCVLGRKGPAPGNGYVGSIGGPTSSNIRPDSYVQEIAEGQRRYGGLSGRNGKPATSSVRTATYTLEVTEGQRRYGGPPPGWKGPDPGKGCELFCANLRYDMLEDDLIDMFSKYGHIWEVRLLMDPMTGANRGFGYVTFTTPEAAQKAKSALMGREMEPGTNLIVDINKQNCVLYVGNIPKSNGREEILQTFNTLTEGLKDVIVYKCPDDNKPNKGFCFLKYESHKAASYAKRRIGSGHERVWGCLIEVKWADYQEEPDQQIMENVKILYVSNLTHNVSENTLWSNFKIFGEIERVRKIKSFAFIHFKEREHAIKAMNELNGLKLDGLPIKITLAKPPPNDKQKQEIMRARYRQQRQGGF